MKRLSLIIILIILVFDIALAQYQQAEIDSLVKMMRTAGREWNDYANPLITIGEPAVPGLIKNAEDKTLPQWNRRIAVMTLNNIRSPLWKERALKMLFDKNEDLALRNHTTAGLRGFELGDVKNKLWELYNDKEFERYKSNIAHLLVTADTTLAYKAFHELYQSQDGYGQRTALQNLIQLRPEESTKWLLDAIQGEDWMTSNLAMDSLIASQHFKASDLLSVYNKPDITEEVQWRIVYILGHRKEPESIDYLVEALQNESWLVHTESAVGLTRFKPAIVLEELLKLKNDDRFYVRNNIKWIISNLKKE
ncbi:MAG: HEAT repeat domain-containing protein [Draconibacterium sp.]|nr:HEAT repeat domain-containing protein [Draconibacterium sp.]